MNWLDFVIGFIVGLFVMFCYMYWVMVTHINKWECGKRKKNK